MRKSRFTVSPIVGILKHGRAGVPIAEIPRQHNIGISCPSKSSPAFAVTESRLVGDATSRGAGYLDRDRCNRGFSAVGKRTGQR